MQREKTWSKRVLEVLKAKIKGRKKENCTSIIANTDSLLLWEAGTEQYCNIFLTSTVVHTYANSNVCVRERFFLAVLGANVSMTFSNSSTFLRSVLTKKMASAKTVFARSVPIVEEAVLLSDKIVHVNKRTTAGRIHAKMQ